jgi:hypothetical protein
MSKMKIKKKLQKIQSRRKNLSQLGITWQTNNSWYEIGIKKKSKWWPSKKTKVQLKNVNKNLSQSRLILPTRSRNNQTVRKMKKMMKLKDK